MKSAAMQTHPIQTEQAYDEALARIASLMGSPVTTAESDELDVLAILVDAYETKHFPIDAPDSITAIQFRIEQQG